MKRSAAILTLCGALAGGAAVAQPAKAPGADVRRLMDDLLAETDPAFLRDAGALTDRPNRLLIGSTRPRPSAVGGVCEIDTFSILARPERDAGAPGGVVIRRVDSERRYQFASEDLGALEGAGPPSEAACASVTEHASFFPASNAGAVRISAYLLAWLAADPAGRMPRRCGGGRCPTAAETGRLLRREAVSSVRDHEACKRPDGACYTVLLHDGDSLWSIDAWAPFGAAPYAFKDIRVRREPVLVID